MQFAKIDQWGISIDQSIPCKDFNVLIKKKIGYEEL